MGLTMQSDLRRIRETQGAIWTLPARTLKRTSL